MIATSTSAPDRFTPAWRCLPSGDPEPDATVYLIVAGGVFDRGALEAELAGRHRAGKVWAYELAEAVRGGVEVLLTDDPDQERVFQLLDQEQELEQRTLELLKAGGDPAGFTKQLAALAAEIPEADRQVLKQVRDVLAEHWQPYRDLLAQQARRREIAPIEALRRFLVGIENGPDFARGRDGMVSPATLSAIDPLELMTAGNHAYSLLFGTGEKRPLAQPSPSGDGLATSSDAASPAAGSSARKSGRRTRG